MKFYSVLFGLVTIVLSGCKFLPVMTKDETIDAAIGKWEHKDINKSDVKAIIFTKKKDTQGDSICITQYKKKDNNGNMADTGVWRFAGVGKIEIWNVYSKDWVLPFTLTDRSTMLLNNDDLYVKDQ
jgi:hypothetical protein